MPSKDKDINQGKIKTMVLLWSICDITVITFSLYSSFATAMQQRYNDCDNHTVT